MGYATDKGGLSACQQQQLALFLAMMSEAFLCSKLKRFCDSHLTETQE